MIYEDIDDEELCWQWALGTAPIEVMKPETQTFDNQFKSTHAQRDNVMYGVSHV